MEHNDIQKSLYRHIFKYIGVFGSVQGLTVLLSLIRNKIAVVLLGSEGLGLSSLLNSVSKLISDTSGLGLNVSAVKHISSFYDASDEGKLRRAILLVRSWSLLAAILGMAVCMLSSFWVSRLLFDNYDYVVVFMLLSVVVALTAVTVGEIAILKSTRKIVQLARVSVYNVILSILITTPVYYFFGIRGIIVALILIALAQMLVTLSVSCRFYPYQIKFEKVFLREGSPVVRMGLFFVVASVLASLSDVLIRSYFTRYADLEVLGYYNSGYMLVFIYGGMVFSAMDSDYFPRLSSVHGLGGELRGVVNRQIEVSVLLIGPMVALMILVMPVVIPLLFKADFLVVLQLSQIAMLSLLMRAVYLPVEYISLSRGDSLTFFVQEFIACLMLIAGVIGGYHYHSFTGIGVGIAVSSFFEVCFVLIYSRLKYGYTLSFANILHLAFFLFLLTLLAFALLFFHGAAVIVVNVVVLLITMLYSLYFLRKLMK